MMPYELDGIEKEVLLSKVVERARATLNYGKPLTQMRAGERIQTWWCEGCGEYHTGSVLGGPQKEAKQQ